MGRGGRGTQRFAGKVVAITGAANGMGAAEAGRFADEGASLLLADVDVLALAETHERLERLYPGRVVAHSLDVSVEEDWASFAALADERFGALHVLVNNAAVTGKGATPIHRYRVGDWEQVLAVNLTGPFLGMRACAPLLTATALAAQSHDATATTSIVNVSSGQALRPDAGNSAYATSKAGLRTLGQVAALDLAPNVRVNTVYPGPTRTGLMNQAIADGLTTAEQLAERLPLQRVSDPDDVASVVLFLANDESRSCTGADFLVDGGRSIGG